MQMPGPFPYGQYPKEGKTREEILGEPLKKWEISMMVKPHLSDNRQVNLGESFLRLFAFQLFMELIKV